MQKLIEALELPRPKLVINLLISQGFSGWVKEISQRTTASHYLYGIAQGYASFTSASDQRVAEEKIDRFMMDVLIPLAVQTNAIVLCTSEKNSCILSTSQHRMLALERTKWGNSEPI